MLSNSSAEYNSKLEKLCFNADDRAVENMIESFTKDTKVWELKCSFNRKCATCCLTLMKQLDFEEIRELKFDTQHEWKNILVDPEMTKKKENNWCVPIIFLAIHTELLDVIKYIFEIAPVVLDATYVFRPSYSERIFLEKEIKKCLILIFQQTTNVKIQHLFLEEENLKKCPIFHRLTIFIDLNFLLSLPRMVVEKICDHNLNLAYKKINIKKCLHRMNWSKMWKHRLEYVDLLLRRKLISLDEILSDDVSFCYWLITRTNGALKLIEEKYEKYKPNLNIKLLSGGTVLHDIVQRSALNYKIAEKILEWEPSLADIPRELDGKTPLMIVCQYKSQKSLHLCSLLIKKYGVDINLLDLLGNSALFYATEDLRLDLMEFFLQNNAQTTQLKKGKGKEKHMCNGLIVKRTNVLINSSPNLKEIEDFNGFVSCLIKVHGLYQQIHDENESFIRFVATKSNLIPFLRVYSILNNKKIFNVNRKLENSVQSAIKNNRPLDVNIRMKMPILTEEIHFDCHFDPNLNPSFYEQEGFQSVKHFITIQDFNKISMGGEILSLQHHCRIVIRTAIFENLPLRHGIFQLDLFKNLGIPNRIQKYLGFMDNIPIDVEDY